MWRWLISILIGVILAAPMALDIIARAQGR